MKPRNNWKIIALDIYLLGSLFAGHFYGLAYSLAPAIAIMWVFTVAGWLTMAILLIPAKSTLITLHRLKIADKFWSHMDRYSLVERLYDEVTDVAYSLLLWIAGAPVLAV